MLLLYDADIHHVDTYMGKLFALMKEQGLFDNTAIFVTSDHGEEFGEHGNWHHSKHLYREVVQIPLIVKLPGLTPPKGKVEVPVSLLDIAPTLLSLAEDRPPKVWYGDSLVKIASRPEKYANRRVLSENVIGHGKRQVHMIALQDLAVKYFRVYCSGAPPYPDGERGFQNGERQELYWLEPDPFEQVNLAPFYPRMKDSMKKETLNLSSQIEQNQEGKTQTGGGKLSKDVLDRLKTLGYL